ncbi:MAG: hypothetical protein R3E62_03715 [Pseudomonadales bacterium]
MKIFATSLLTLTVLYSAFASADTVVGEEADTTLGKGVGGWAGVLIGGAAGGPVGALAAGALGVWFGGEVQEGTGQSGRAYRVQRDDGSETVVRSPKQTWQQGDRVDVIGNRLVAAAQ